VSGATLALAFALAAAIAYVAFRLGSLSTGGAWAAFVVGGLTFGFGGWLAGALLILFFVGSSALSRLGARRKTGVAAQFEKGGRRDERQVLANGGLAALLAVTYGLTGETVLLVALAGALAAANADTWATELGVLSRRRPRLVTTGRSVPPGTSGAVSREGTLATAAGASLIGLVAGWGAGSATVVVATALAGFLGATADSILGATVQAIYYCPTCEKDTERHPLHSCGSPTVLARGWPWLRNDGVNLAATFVGAVAAAAIWTFLG
jgi:uncharacterized protein (TIGR00297 family)